MMPAAINDDELEFEKFAVPAGELDHGNGFIGLSGAAFGRQDTQRCTKRIGLQGQVTVRIIRKLFPKKIKPVKKSVE